MVGSEMLRTCASKTLVVFSYYVYLIKKFSLFGSNLNKRQVEVKHNEKSVLLLLLVLQLTITSLYFLCSQTFNYYAFCLSHPNNFLYFKRKLNIQFWAVWLVSGFFGFFFCGWISVFWGFSPFENQRRGDYTFCEREHHVVLLLFFFSDVWLLQLFPFSSSLLSTWSNFPLLFSCAAHESAKMLIHSVIVLWDEFQLFSLSLSSRRWWGGFVLSSSTTQVFFFGQKNNILILCAVFLVDTNRINMNIRSAQERLFFSGVYSPLRFNVGLQPLKKFTFPFCISRKISLSRIRRFFSQKWYMYPNPCECYTNYWCSNSAKSYKTEVFSYKDK